MESIEKNPEEILEEYGCPDVPFDENVTMFYPAIIEAMEEYVKQSVNTKLDNAVEKLELKLQKCDGCDCDEKERDQCQFDLMKEIESLKIK